MKRAFPQKIKSVSLPLATPEVISQEIAPRIADTPKQTAPETHRRVRTSAAMIGLAISMGASSLLLPKQGDKAMATEPIANDPPTATATGSAVSEVSLSSSPEVESALSTQLGASALGGQQVVQVGQKLNLVGLETGVNSVDFAKTSPIVTARLKAAGIGKEVSQGELATLNPAILAENADDLLKAEQNQSLDQLKQKREQLRDSLTQLRLESQTASEFSTSTVRGLNFATPQSIASSEEGIAYYPLIEAVPSDQPALAPTVTAATRLSAPQNNPLQLEALPNSVEPSVNLEIPVVPTSEVASPSWQSSVAAASATKPTLPNSVLSTTTRFGERTQVYQVKPGDSVESIARRHGLTRSELVDANQLDDPNDLSVSQVLRIPQPEFNPTAPQLVTIQPESLATTTEAPTSVVEELASSESVIPSTLQVEQPTQTEAVTATLTPQAVPSPTAESLKTEIQNLREKYQTPESQIPAQPLPLVALEVASVSAPQVNTLSNSAQYRVSPGDTLDAIARRYGISRSELIQANQLANPNLIKVNQVLQIPGTDSSNLTAIPSLNFNTSDEVSVAAAQPVAVFNSSSSYSQRSFESSPIVPSPQAQSNTAQVGSVNRIATRTEDGAPTSYVEGLMNEINQMRERYQEQPIQSSANPSVSGAASSPSSQAVNPEFSPNSSTDAPQAQEERSQQPQQQVAIVPATTRSTARPSSQQVATAPMPPESYNPALQIPYGRVVSPELPPLAPAERYLPEGAPTFDGYVWPAKGVFTSGYGWRWGRMHRGIDIAGPVGTPIVAAAGGVVDFAGWNSGGYGNLVDIRHPDGSITRYAHNNRLLVRTGQQVDQGQQIAEMGSTGYSTGPHLHFEIHPAGQGAVNPMAFLPR